MMTKTHIHCPPGYQVTQVVTEQSYKGTIMILSYLIMKEGSEIALVVFEFGINVFISLFSWKRVEELKLKKSWVDMLRTVSWLFHVLKQHVLFLSAYQWKQCLNTVTLYDSVTIKDKFYSTAMGRCKKSNLNSQKKSLDPNPVIKKI